METDFFQVMIPKMCAISRTLSHKLDLTLFGHRQNAFGANHLCGRIAWTGPNAWRTDGENFSYDYLLSAVGIMRSPLILKG